MPCQDRMANICSVLDGIFVLGSKAEWNAGACGRVQVARRSRSVSNHQRATSEMAPPPTVRDAISLNGIAMLMRRLDSVSSQVHNQQASQRESDVKASIKPSLPKHYNSTTSCIAALDGAFLCAIRDTTASG